MRACVPVAADPDAAPCTASVHSMVPGLNVSACFGFVPPPFTGSANSKKRASVCKTRSSPEPLARVRKCTLPRRRAFFGWLAFGKRSRLAVSALRSSVSFAPLREPWTLPCPSRAVSQPSGAKRAVRISALKFIELSLSVEITTGFVSAAPRVATIFSARNAESRVRVNSPASSSDLEVSALTGPCKRIVRVSRPKSRLLPDR